jgi:hypothetical protein
MARSKILEERDRSLAFWAAKGLMGRARYVVHFEGCRTVADVRRLGRAYFEQAQNCGPKTLQQIGEAIGGWGKSKTTDQEPRRPRWPKAAREPPAPWRDGGDIALPPLWCSAMSPAACHTLRMKTFRLVPRGKKYWIEEIGEDGSKRVVAGFPTEEAALQCLRDLQAGTRDTGG